MRLLLTINGSNEQSFVFVKFYFIVKLTKTFFLTRFGLETGKWFEVPSMLEPRFCHKLVELNGHLFAIGGIDGELKRTNSVECYDSLESKWKVKAPMNKVRKGHIAMAHDNKIYVFGGCGNSSSGNSVECYDPLIGEWIMVNTTYFINKFYNIWRSELFLLFLQLTTFDLFLNGAGLSIVGERFFIAGGFINEKNRFSSVYKYDLKTFKKELIAPMKYKRVCFGFFEIPPYDSNF